MVIFRLLMTQAYKNSIFIHTIVENNEKSTF